MSSVHGHRGHTVTTRNSPVQRGRSNVHSSQIPTGITTRVRPATQVNSAAPATRRVQSLTTVAARRNTAPTIGSRVASLRSSVALVEGVVDLTCNSPQQTARQTQLPVVLGGAVSSRVPATRPKPAAKSNVRKRPTTAGAALDVSPSKKYRNLQDLMCPVCFDDISLTNPVTEKPVFSTNCGHLFCKPCILACLERNNSCPICRKSQSSTDIHPIYINEHF